MMRSRCWASFNSNDQAVAAAVQALLAAGATATAMDDDGWTPLRYALLSINSLAAEALLAAMLTEAALE